MASVARAVEKKYPSIEVSEKSKKPGKDGKKSQILHELKAIANELDQKGHLKFANEVEQIMLKIADFREGDPEPWPPEKEEAHFDWGRKRPGWWDEVLAHLEENPEDRKAMLDLLMGPSMGEPPVPSKYRAWSPPSAPKYNKEKREWEERSELAGFWDPEQEERMEREQLKQVEELRPSTRLL